MFDVESLDYIKTRINRIEGTHFLNYVPADQSGSLMERLQIVERKMKSLDIEIPEMGKTISLVKKVKSILLLKQDSLTTVNDQISVFLSRRDALKNQLNTLANIKRLSGVLDESNFAGESCYYYCLIATN
jgi:hypothetical protein